MLQGVFIAVHVMKCNPSKLEAIVLHNVGQ